MQSPVDELPANLTYHTEDGPRDRPPVEGPVLAVELEYFCPYCDHPTSAITTPPVDADLTDQCPHCERVNRLMSGSDAGGQSRIDVAALEESAYRVRECRRARLCGERRPEVVEAVVDSKQRIIWAAILSSVAMVVGMLATLSSLSLVVSESVLKPVTVASIVLPMLASLVTGAKYRWDVSRGVGSDLPDYVLEHLQYASHGAKVARDKADLYVPPPVEEAEEPDVEQEVA